MKSSRVQSPNASPVSDVTPLENQRTGSSAKADRICGALVERRQSFARRPAVIACVVLTALIVGCRAGPANEKPITPEYDTKTGKLRLLKYDSNGNGKADTFSYMDGSRVLRIEIDKDEDGTIDRWEHYGPDQQLEKIGFSRLNDGKEDAWWYAGPDGSVARIDVSTRRDGTVTRVEHYEHEKLSAAEEDSDQDGHFDRWETYDDGRLASVAFDSTHRGTPDRRLVYGPDGTARLEVDPTGNGRFVPAPPDTAPRLPTSRK